MTSTLGITLAVIIAMHVLQLSDARNLTCASNEFTCNNGECILQRWRCDNEADCTDSSDEVNCESYLPCTSKQFQCKKNKNCITIKWRCDGDGDCSDMSDELDCYNSSCVAGEYRCTNGLCIDSDYVCDDDDDCGDESDESGCEVLLHCKEDRFRCDEYRCIYKRWVCDGDPDCRNGNDEKNCSKMACAPRQWACQSGECIMESHRCDGDLDCNDNSDEIGCPTIAGDCVVKGMFRCQSGQCISGEWRCDGDKDCLDGTDEKDCGEHTCPNNTYLCPSSTGRCINKHWLCDGDKDCQDGSDEKNCNTTSTSCRRTQFHCTNGQCVDQQQVCDRKVDCDDGSDEALCPSWKNQTSCGTNNGGCQHHCHDGLGSFYCSCKHGFQLDAFGAKTCTDINECEITGFCSQMCVNTYGNYTCSCHEGYILQPDGRKCKAIGPTPSLLFSNQVDIRQVDTKTTNKAFFLVAVELENAIALDYYLEESLVFWTDVALRVIKRAYINGTNIQNVIKFGLDTPCGLAVDWLGKKLFWADAGSGRIEVSNFDGTQRKVLFWRPLGKIRAIALHPSFGYLYWTEWDIRQDLSNKSSITRANMDGTNVQRILHQEISWPNGLVIDFAMNRIFWIDAKLSVIHSANLDGTGLRTVMGSNDLIRPFAITLFEDDIYWTDPGRKAIFKANKFDGADYTLIKDNLKSPHDITMFHPQRQPRAVYSCGLDNKGCSHICLVSNSTDFHCACPTGYKLRNSTHCSDDIDKFVSYVGDFAVRQISLDTPDLLDVVLPFGSVMDVLAIDWDPVENEMYWADVDDEDQVRIRKGRMTSPYHESIVYEFPGKISGLAVDWLTRKLYWSDELRDHLRVSNLNGSDATVLLWKKVEKPRNLLLDVSGRYMYWFSHGTQVSLNRAGMNGCCQRKLISNGLVNPTDLILDKTTHTLYWADGGNKLQHFSLKTNVQNFVKLSYHSEKLSIFSIAVYEDNVYWTDRNLKKVLFVNKKTGKNAKVIGKYRLNPVRIGAFKTPEKNEVHSCNMNNGGCSHLCLLSPVQTVQCACPAGRRLENDTKTCQSEIPRFILVNSFRRLHHVPLSMSYKINILLPSQGNYELSAFDVDARQRNIYFTKTESICVLPVSGGKEKCILSNMVYSPGGITVDPLRNYIFWTDYLTKKIYLAEGNGKFWTVIVWENLNIPSSITVAYKNGYIFWSDIGKKPSISRANTDGTSRIEIVSSSIKSPNSLAIDHSLERLYWSDYRQQRIEQCDFNGKNRMIFAQSLAGPTSLSVLGRFIYWSEWKSQQLRRADKRHGNVGTTIITGMRQVTGIKAVNLRKVPVSTSGCATKNGGCSHFCLQNKTGTYCACPVGLTLLKDQRQCRKSPMKSLLFSSGPNLSRISLDIPDFTGVTLPFAKTHDAFHLTYDVVEKRVYWTTANGIFSAFVDGTDTQMVIRTSLSSSDGLGIDWIGRILYWTDGSQRSIDVTTLDGRRRGALISENLRNPRELVVHSIKGFLFWVDSFNNSRIERSHLDGQSRKIIVNKKIFSPTGLTIDPQGNGLYWADSFYDTIQRCNLEGEERSLVLKKSGNVFGLALFGSYIFWTDNKNRRVQRANIETGLERATHVCKMNQPKGIVAISNETPQGVNYCSEDNGNCSGLCFSTPNGPTCGSICNKRVYLRESCQFRETSTSALMTTPKQNTSCVHGKQCSTVEISFARKERKVTLVYIVGAVVLFVFLITMSVLLYLCIRRYKRAVTEGNGQKITMPKVLYRKRKQENNTFSDKDIFPSDPSITFLPNNSQNSEEPSTVLTSCNKISGKYDIACKCTKCSFSEERQCLTISDV